MKKYNAGIYLRLSRENMQDDNSIETQRKITTDYAMQKGYKIVKQYVDNGYSGILSSRPGLNEMMVDISRGFINMVIVKDISRLTRDKNKTGWYTEIFFPDNDVRFISVTEFIDSGKRYEIDDTIMLRGIANQYYISDISKKIKSSKEDIKKRGDYAESCVPYGYMKVKDKKHEICIDKEVQDNVKLIYDMYIKGNTSTQIANYLNSKNIQNPSRYFNMKKSSNKWRQETINSILSNPFYIGNTVMNKYITNCMTKICKRNNDKTTWIIRENTHKAIIDKQKYEMVQNIKKKRAPQKKIRYEYLLKQLIYCGHCKNRCQYKVLKKESIFICGIVYKKPDICTNTNYIKESILNQIVIMELQQRLKNLDLNILENVIKKYLEKEGKYTKRISEYEKKIKRLERIKSNIYKDKCRNIITKDVFENKYLEIKDEIEQSYMKIEILKIKVKDIEKEIKKHMQEIKQAKNFNNIFLRDIIYKIEIYKGNNINIIFKI